MDYLRIRIKRVLKSFLSSLLVYSGIAFLIYVLIIRKQRDHFRILVYHRINDSNSPFAQSMNVSTGDFEKQLKFLRKRFNILSLETIYKFIKSQTSLPARTLAITFDDGYKDNYENAFPLLNKFRLPATMFLVADYVDSYKSFWWDEIEAIVEKSDLEKIKLFLFDKLNQKELNSKLAIYLKLITHLNTITEHDKQNLISDLKSHFGTVNSIYQNLTWDDVKYMEVDGISFGAHSYSHSILTKIPPNQLEKEIHESKRYIENRLNIVSSFAYPNGGADDFNEHIITILKKSSYDCAVTCMRGVNHVADDLYQLKRIVISGDESFATFICRCYNIF